MIKIKSRTWFRGDPPEALYNSLHDVVLGLRHVGFVVSVKETEESVGNWPADKTIFLRKYVVFQGETSATVIWKDTICESSFKIETTLSASMKGENELLIAVIQSFFDGQNDILCNEM